jgi:hypothetical protein
MGSIKGGCTWAGGLALALTAALPATGIRLALAYC